MSVAPASPLAALLLDASDPYLLIDMNGEVRWLNRAAMRLLSRILIDGNELKSAPKIGDRLSAWLGAASIRAITGVQEYQAFDLALHLKNLGEVHYSAVTLNVSSGDPDQQLFQLAIKATAPQSEELRQREELLATVAHDLKNPLSAIFGYADALLDTPSGAGLSADQRNVVARVRATAARSIDLVRNYQQVCELDTRSIAPPNTPVDLNHVATTVLQCTWRDDAHSPRLTISLSHEPLPVLVERSQLDRAISNLFSNALKYTPSNGTITVISRKSDGDALFEINNSGAPIAASELPQIFSRYTRASSSQGTSGSGLGLYIVQRVAENAHGEVAVQSSVHGGTTFTLRLPLQGLPAPRAIK